jgi:serine phosphatase RsbU (regulator of sigma subunit)
MAGARFEIGVASRSRDGDGLSGDRFVVCERDAGLLIAVVDGLGHGAEAASAASLAVETVKTHADEPVISLLRRCHEVLRSTRGAVMSLAEIQYLNNTVTWLSVGNVEGIIRRADPGVTPDSERIVQRGGVVGYRLPELHATALPLMRGDTLIFATDGIAVDFHSEVRPAAPPQDMAEYLCSRYATRDDDALILIAQYAGAGT